MVEPGSAPRRRRIWCEHLPPQELGAPATVALLQRFGLEPLVALPPRAEGSAMAEALARLDRGGVPVGLWPLLEDEDGYWPSAESGRAFALRAREVLRFADESGVRTRTFAIDLEPPLPLTRALVGGEPGERSRAAAAILERFVRRSELDSGAIEAFSALARELADRRVETLAAMVPPIALDLAAGTEIWERLLRTPVTQPRWEAVSAMAYTSMIARALPGQSPALARAVLYEIGRLLASLNDVPRASLSIGLTGTGKLGDEAVYAEPGDLSADVATAEAAGVFDLALFCLEGTLARGAPETWLSAFTAAPKDVDLGAAERAARSAARLASTALRGLARALERLT